MYKEKDERKTGFSVVLVFVIGIVVLHTVIYCLPMLAIIKDVSFMAVMVASVLVLIKRYLTSYEYELTEEKIIIRAILGGRERGTAEISFDGIECFDLADSEGIKSISGETRVMCTGKGKRYALATSTEAGSVKIVFAPSDRLAEMIKNKLSAEEEEK